MISVAWTPAAVAQLHNQHLTPAGNTFVQNHTQNWVLANAGGWALNTNHQTVDTTTGLTATAHVYGKANGDTNVNITSFQ